MNIRNMNHEEHEGHEEKQKSAVPMVRIRLMLLETCLWICKHVSTIENIYHVVEI